MNGFYLAIGKQGSGKTLFMVKNLVDDYTKQKRRVYSNTTLFDIPYTKITFNKERTSEDLPTFNELLTSDKNIFNDSIILWDEIHLDLDSLDFMKGDSRKKQVFFSQLRKRNILILGTTQYIMHVDVRIRRQCKYVFDMSNIKDNIFQVVTNEIDGYYTEEISRLFIDLHEYYNFYDTKEIIE